MKKLSKITLVWALVLCSWALKAQDEADVKNCINNYLDGITTGDQAKLKAAFHTQAMLRTVNNANGKMVEIPIDNFISKTPAGGIKASTKLINYSLIGQAAFATVEISLPEFKYVDYLSMLKFGSEWKIICRVYSRADLDAQPVGSASTGGTKGTSAKKTAPAKKAKSDDGW
jgi:hypothetical protein